jgi:DNA-binding HxlR family transcriptional regulator
MPRRRSYGDRCGVARALDRVGERWALLVVRELILGPKRFTALRAGLPQIGPDVLSQRLRELEQLGVLRQTRLAPPLGVNVYELTERGRELEPVILALGRWGSTETFAPDAEAFGADSAMLALKTLFSATRAGELEGDYELRISEQPFRATVAGAKLELVRGEAEDPIAVLETDATTLGELLWRGLELDDAVSSGTLAVSGSKPAARRFLELFPL